MKREPLYRMIINQIAICIMIILLPIVVIGQTEICNNGIDDDNDGLIDCADSDCCGVMGCEDALPDFSLPNTFITLPDCQTVILNICNDGVADFSGILPISVYDGIPVLAAANLLATFPEMITVSGGDCVEVAIDISTLSELDTYFIFLNDDGSLTTPFDVSTSFPITDIHECDFQNNLGLYTPPSFPATEIEASICEGESYILPDGEVVTTDGIYTDTLETSFACDSIIITTLEFLDDCDFEDCTNGIDDDGDGLIDVFDPDCDCQNNFIVDSGFDNYPDCCWSVNCTGTDEWVRAGGGNCELYQPNCPAIFPFNGMVTNDNFAAGGFNYNIEGTGEAELMGTCLSESLIAGNQYTFTIDIGGSNVDDLTEDFEVLVMGITDCDEILDYRPMSDSSMCSVLLPREELVRINLFGLEEGWNSLTVNFTPTTDVEAIFFSPACDHFPSANQYNYVHYDDIQISPASLNVMETTGNLCADNIIISVEENQTAVYTWYQDSIEILGETSNILDLTGTNISVDQDYHVYIVLPNGECELIGPAILPDTTYSSEEMINLCYDEVYTLPDGTIIDTEGVYMLMHTALDGCDSLATLNISYFPELEYDFNVSTDCTSQTLAIDPNNSISEIIVDGESYGTMFSIDGLMVGSHTLELIDNNDCRYSEDFEISEDYVDYSLTLEDASFNCQTISGELCWVNLAPNTPGNDTYIYAYNSQTEDLILITIFDLQFNQSNNCTTFLALVSNFDFSNYNQLLVVSNAANEVMSLSELDDPSNYFNECIVTDNYALIDFQTETLDLGSDIQLCDTEYLIVGPSDFETYEWSTGTDEQDLLVTTTGEYILTVTDFCDSIYLDTINVTLNQLGMVTTDIQNTCSGTSNGAVELIIENTPAEDLDYAWEGNVGMGSTAMDLPVGEYMVTVTNGECEEIIDFQILNTPPATFAILQSPPLCFATTEGFIEIQSSQNIQSVILDNQEYEFPIVFENLPAGTYDLTIIDAGGCEIDEQVIIEELPAIDASIADTFYLVLFEEQQLELIGNIPDGAVYNWAPSAALSCVDCSDPIFIGGQSTTVTVSLTIDGCTQEYSVFLNVDEDVDVYIPNVFNPDSGTGNDLFGSFTPIIFETYSMWIYDRWGNRVYSIEEAEELTYWGGTFKQKLVETGVYVYIIEIRLSTDRVLQYNGNVTVLR